AEDGIRDFHVTGVQTCALPISTGDVPGPRPPDPGVWVPAPPAARPGPGRGRARGGVVTVRWNPGRPRRCPECNTIVHTAGPVTRSEERRVGKEWRSRRATWQQS